MINRNAMTKVGLFGIAVGALALTFAVLPAQPSRAQLINPATQKLIDQARKDKWQSVTVHNHAATTVYVMFGTLPASHGALNPNSQPYGTKHSVLAGQSWSDNVDVSQGEGVLSVFADVTGKSPYCLENEVPDRSLKSYTVTVSGTLFKISCDVAKN